jgi:ribulose-5-phosphate 4-epimerase/fuculose-1-phosphate aldolase
MEMNEAEQRMRVDLAGFLRLVAGYGWDDLLLAHISARVPGEDAYLVNPYGLLFEEVTASSLLKVNYQGEKLAPSEFDISPEANVIHGAVLTGRADINCVAHVHTTAGTAVASQGCGLLNISQQSMLVASSLAYHDYEGVVLDPAEAPRLQQDLADKQHMILRNHGLLTVGATVSRAFHALYNLQRSFEIQVQAQAEGQLLEPISSEVMDKTRAMFARVGTAPPPDPDPLWQAMLRRLHRNEPDFAS